MSMHADTYANTLMGQTYHRLAFRAQGGDEARRWQTTFRRKLADLLGLDQIASRGDAPLTAIKIGVESQPDHVREEWTLETEPGFRLPFYILRPLEATTDAARKYPVVITPHGHGILGKKTYVGVYADEVDRRDMEEGERDIARQAVREGYIAVAPDMRGFASLRLKEHVERNANNSCEMLQHRAYMFGRTLIGERVWDMMRLIDWLSLDPQIDAERIVVTGNSGGGTVTLFTGAMDERVAVTIPSCYFCTFEHSILSIRHCACNYVPGLALYGEMWDVAALIAPRPFLAVAGREDRIFPIAATEYAYDRLKEIYAVFGAEDVCRLSIGEGGHRYYKKDVWPFVKEMVGSATDRR